MRMIDVLTKLANGEIEDKSTLLVENEEGETFEYVYYERYHVFRGQCCSALEDDFGIDKDFLNFEVELTRPEEKKYLVHINLLSHSRMRDLVFLSIIDEKGHFKNHFTKSELQSIQAVRDYLEVIQGNYELIEVEDNAND